MTGRRGRARSAGVPAGEHLLGTDEGPIGGGRARDVTRRGDRTGQPRAPQLAVLDSRVDLGADPGIAGQIGPPPPARSLRAGERQQAVVVIADLVVPTCVSYRRLLPHQEVQ